MNQDFNGDFQNNEEAEQELFQDELNDSSAEAVDYYPEKIVIPEAEKKQNGSNKGLKIFCIALAVVLLMSFCSFGGYYLGVSGGLKSAGSGNEVNISLQNKPANADEGELSEIYQKLSPSVVGILVYNDSAQMSEATGVVYSSDGYIVTNDHIYSSVPSAKFKIYTSDGSEYNAYYVAGDTRSDLAVLKISETVNLTVGVFGNSDEVLSGEKVCAIGCPNGYSAKSTITTGIVSTPKVRMSISSSYSSNFIQTDTAINPGNSGGALVNMYGQIVGITSSKISGTSYEGIGFAIPSKTVKKVVESLIENGNVKGRSRLGISYNFYNSAMAELSGLASYGLLVREVSNDSDLYGKIEVGDIITRVNDIPITDDAIILDLLEETAPGDKIILTVINSDGSTQTVSAGLLNDEGSSSYVNSNGDAEQGESTEEFNWPEGF